MNTPPPQEYFLEGAFRNVHTRLRMHAESVAFFGGGAREGATVAAGFDALMRHLSAVIDVRRGLAGCLGWLRRKVLLW